MRHDFLVSLTLAIFLVIVIDSFVRSFRAAIVTILALLATVAVATFTLITQTDVTLDGDIPTDVFTERFLRQ